MTYPITYDSLTQSCPFGYNPLSSTGLLSPLVKILSSLLGLYLLLMSEFVRFLNSDHSMHDRYSLSIKLVHYNVTWNYLFFSCQKQYISSVIRWLHTSTISMFEY